MRYIWSYLNRRTQSWLYQAAAFFSYGRVFRGSLHCAPKPVCNLLLSRIEPRFFNLFYLADRRGSHHLGLSYAPLQFNSFSSQKENKQFLENSFVWLYMLIIFIYVYCVLYMLIYFAVKDLVKHYLETYFKYYNQKYKRLHVRFYCFNYHLFVQPNNCFSGEKLGKLLKCSHCLIIHTDLHDSTGDCLLKCVI